MAAVAPASTHSPRVLAHAPAELTNGRLHRLGEGIGRVVYASENWVVKRERSNSAVVALIVVWKMLRRLERLFPSSIGKRLVNRPAGQIRFLRIIVQGAMKVVPRSAWFTTHIGEVWRTYRRNDIRGRMLAEEHLTGTPLVPDRITFPPVNVEVGGWPGWICVSEATERVESTLDDRLAELAESQRFDEVERWLNRFLEVRQQGWRRGLFSVDSHLKNFGVTHDRIVLLDPGGLTRDWEHIEQRLTGEESVDEPHIRLGLGSILASRPDIAERFNARWKDTVSVEGVLRNWPDSPNDNRQ